MLVGGFVARRRGAAACRLEWCSAHGIRGLVGDDGRRCGTDEQQAGAVADVRAELDVVHDDEVVEVLLDDIELGLVGFEQVAGVALLGSR